MIRYQISYYLIGDYMIQCPLLYVSKYCPFPSKIAFNFFEINRAFLNIHHKNNYKEFFKSFSK